MSARRWPDGVPQIPLLHYAVWVAESQHNPKDGWQQPHDWGIHSDSVDAQSDADTWEPFPAVVLCGDRVTYANAAARALGIVPEPEPASTDHA